MVPAEHGEFPPSRDRMIRDTSGQDRVLAAPPANPRRRQFATRTLLIVAATVIAAASGVFPPQMAFLSGAVALVLTGCVGVDQAYREIDVRIYVMIAGVIPLGLGMEKTGTAAFLADQLQQLTAGWTPLAVMLALYWGAALVTQILSDAATTVLLGPISLALALALGLPPRNAPRPPRSTTLADCVAPRRDGAHYARGIPGAGSGHTIGHALHRPERQTRPRRRRLR